MHSRQSCRHESPLVQQSRRHLYVVDTTLIEAGRSPRCHDQRRRPSADNAGIPGSFFLRSARRRPCRPLPASCTTRRRQHDRGCPLAASEDFRLPDKRRHAFIRNDQQALALMCSHRTSAADSRPGPMRIGSCARPGRFAVFPCLFQGAAGDLSASSSANSSATACTRLPSVVTTNLQWPQQWPPDTDSSRSRPSDHWCRAVAAAGHVVFFQLLVDRSLQVYDASTRSQILAVRRQPYRSASRGENYPSRRVRESMTSLPFAKPGFALLLEDRGYRHPYGDSISTSLSRNSRSASWPVAATAVLPEPMGPMRKMLGFPIMIMNTAASLRPCIVTSISGPVRTRRSGAEIRRCSTPRAESSVSRRSAVRPCCHSSWSS